MTTEHHPDDARRLRVVLGVSGGIAAYKAATLLRRFTEAGHDVTVVPTAAALRFVGAPTWSALSGRPVAEGVWDDVHEVRHVRLGQEADLVLVAPATADLVARAAHGLADDLLTNVLLTARGTVVLAPAMHTEMWEHPATVANVATLRSRGVHVVEPASGRLTGVDTGPGRLPEPEDIFAAALAALAKDASAGPSGPSGAPGQGQDGPLRGRRVVVSAGGTREPLDPVRFLGNRSSGKQGYALAQVAAERGADVTLVAANTELPTPAGVQLVRVESALELQAAMREHAPGSDVVVMAAAVADFRPDGVAGAKIKKTHEPGADPDAGDAPVIRLVRNPDILAGLVRARDADRAANPAAADEGGRRAADSLGGTYVVGFAAETGDEEGDVLHHARAKLARKGVDLLVANEVGVDKTFGAEATTVHLLGADDPEPEQLGPASKVAVAGGIWDAIEERAGFRNDRPTR
ncbi:bifunctional phosphopantothenoylcysteine decarboxylase/phosphopantothenate--cysteine ligase CoaBC [Agilicoccus flavus]|uniref:bifunctional phosphopantothenoylcysteine decarboxylase/phosphopantothenate--cysteine ligase CoaBC n=1 Tax=Agilicoccus flavus TaxID=2775968 RepID=UPI001CF6265C|nr:bifunctional phosphopantothenoylcysteine decarboxylase/phosphopantothenate--cysteine ligase CoaBC [Agilicoccus flavus]